MRKFIKATIISLLTIVSVSSFAGTYDGSYYTDQQRLDMFNNYANSLYAKEITNGFGSAESMVKYEDTRLLNGKKGYIGSILVTRPDAFINSNNGYAKQSIIHLFDNSVVNKYNVSDTTADCRSFTSPTRASCWGSGGQKRAGLIGLVEIKTKTSSGGGSVGTEFRQYDNPYFNIYRADGTITRQQLYTAYSLDFNDTTIEMGLIYNALQNSDGTFPTREVISPPMDLGSVVIGLPETMPIVVTPQDCSNPDYTKKTSSSICLVGQVIEGCKLTTDNYQASINAVAGNVGLTSVDLKITCSTGVNYHLKPIHDIISIPGTQETLKLTGWKDSGRGDKLTPLSAKVMTGNGSEQSIPIYFTLEGKGPTGTYGNSLVNKFVGTAVYPVQIDY